MKPLPSEMRKAKDSAQQTPKGKVAPKLTLRKSPRGSKEKSSRLQEAAKVEQSSVPKKTKTRQAPTQEVQPAPVDKGKRKLEDLQPSFETTTDQAKKKIDVRAVKTRLKGVHISEPSPQQGQVEDIDTPAPTARKKQKVTESAKLTKSKSPSPATRSRKKTVDEASAPAPTAKSKTRQEEKGKTVPEQQATAPLPLRKKMLARKSKTQKVLPSASAHFPFISADAKQSFETILKSKSVIRERALHWQTPQAAPEVKEIIQHLQWETLCAQPGEAVDALVKEFYANAQNEEDEKVFVRGKWIDVSSQAINKALKTPDFEADEYFAMSVKGISTKELEATLCQSTTKTSWTQGKKGKRNFHTDALKPSWLPLFKLVCSRLLPTTHTSDVTMDRAILLYAMVKKLKIDVGSLIKTAMTKMGMPSKALWYPALVTQLCLSAGVEVAQNELKIKPAQPISATVLDEKALFGGNKAAHDILKELRHIKENQEKLLQCAKYQQEWNHVMMKLCPPTADFPFFPKSVFAETSTGGEGPSKTPADLDEPSESEDEEDEDDVWGPDEEVAMDFDDEQGDTFTTKPDQSDSEDDNSSATS